MFSVTQLLTKLITIKSKAQVAENSASLNFIAQINENDLQFKHNNNINTKQFVEMMETSMDELKKQLGVYAKECLEGKFYFFQKKIRQTIERFFQKLRRNVKRNTAKLYNIK